MCLSASKPFTGESQTKIDFSNQHLVTIRTIQTWKWTKGCDRML